MTLSPGRSRDFIEEDEWHVSRLTVGQVADRMHIAPSAVRWYDDHGLLPSERTAGNQRRFFADVLCRVAMIRAAQRVGLSINQIRQALSALPPREIPTLRDWERLAEHLRAVVGQRIDELFIILDELGPEAPAETAPEGSTSNTTLKVSVHRTLEERRPERSVELSSLDAQSS